MSSIQEFESPEAERVSCLLVDDDTKLRLSISEYLAQFNMQISLAADGMEMQSHLEKSEFSVILLDYMLPGSDGLALCRALRRQSNIPIIFLTALGDSVNRIVGLESGADDYIAKPFEPRELLARIRAVVRRSRMVLPGTGTATRKGNKHTVIFDGWIFNLLRHELVSPNGVVLVLSSAEYRLLSTFVRHPRRVLSRGQLLDFSRGSGVIASDRSVDLAVSRLRQKMHDPERSGKIIRTIRGEGYLFDPKDLHY